MPNYKNTSYAKTTLSLSSRNSISGNWIGLLTVKHLNPIGETRPTIPHPSTIHMCCAESWSGDIPTFLSRNVKLQYSSCTPHRLLSLERGGGRGSSATFFTKMVFRCWIRRGEEWVCNILHRDGILVLGFWRKLDSAWLWLMSAAPLQSSDNFHLSFYRK